MNDFNNQEDNNMCDNDKEFYERYHQEKLEYDVMTVFYTKCFNKYKIISPLVIMSIILIMLSLLFIIPSCFMILAIIIIGICAWFDEYTDKHILTKPINDEYLKKVHQQIQKTILFKNNINLSESNDSFNQKINTFIKHFLKKEERPITYKDIINLYENHSRQLKLIEKEFKNKNNINKQSESIDKYFR